MNEAGYRRFLTKFLEVYRFAGGPAMAFDPSIRIKFDTSLRELVDEGIRRGHLAQLNSEECVFTEAGWRQADEWETTG